jgi:hypothetical protein
MRANTFGHPAPMPPYAWRPMGESRSKPACSNKSLVPVPSGMRWPTISQMSPAALKGVIGGSALDRSPNELLAYLAWPLNGRNGVPEKRRDALQ